MLSHWKDKNGKEKGIAIMMTAGIMMALVPVAGLAIDGGVAYVLKSRLTSATDAAALAAARSLSVGLTLAQQEAEAKARAIDFFHANFKPNAFGTKNLTVDAVVAESNSKTRTVTITAGFDAPQYFMRILGFKYIHIAGRGQASRRDVNLIMVLDRSGSMGSHTDPNSACAKMKEAAKYFVGLFAEGRDRLGMITYSSSYFPAYPAKLNFKTSSPTLVSVINNIQCAGWTGIGSAISQAYLDLKAINEQGALNVILLFTDGNANTVTADYPVKKLTDTRFGGYRGYRVYNTTTQAYDGTATCTSTSSTCSMLPSPCKDGVGNQFDRNNGQTKKFFDAPNWNPNWNPLPIRGSLAGDDWATTGQTQGVMRHIGTTMNASSEFLTTSGCAFSTANFLTHNSNTASDRNSLARRDIAFMPDEDIYGNSTSGYRPVSTFTSGPYAGRKRIDRPVDVTSAAFNVADNLAKRAREDPLFGIVFYTIGLGSVDHVFLRRIANDPASPIYNPELRDGLYIYAPSQDQLKDAFMRIASEILRISL